MDNVQSSATHSATLVRQRGIEHKDDSPELPLQVRLSQSERRPSAVENKYVKKILEFFERTAGRFKSWKESRNEKALRRSGDRAVSTITRGLATDDFKKVYQGLKRLHNGEQKLSNMDGTVGALDKDTYISDRLDRVVSECFPYKNNPDNSKKVKYLREFAKYCDLLVPQCSDRHTLFHRMLVGLERFGLISSSYVDSRKKRIETLDDKVAALVIDMQTRLLRKKADDSGRHDTMCDLGLHLCMHYGPEKASGYFGQIADEGHNDALLVHNALLVMHTLGYLYKRGHGGLDKSREAAALMFQEAAKRGEVLSKGELDEMRRSAGTGID